MATLLQRTSTLAKQLLNCQKGFVMKSQIATHSTFSAGICRWVSPKHVAINTATPAKHVAINTATPVSNHNFSTLAGSYHGFYRNIESMSGVVKNPLNGSSPNYSSSLVTQTRGMKMKGVLKKRCEHCKIRRRNGNTYIICKEHPRHKQKLIKETRLFLPGTWINRRY